MSRLQWQRWIRNGCGVVGHDDLGRQYTQFVKRQFVRNGSMLHAIEKNKTRYYKRYLGHRDESEKRIPSEDEITSTILGPLEFLDAASTFQFWMQVFRKERLATNFPLEHPVRCECMLWPKNNGIEPDAHYKYFFNDGSRFDILIELKWRAPIIPKDELHRQWQTYLTDDARRNCWHVYIAPEISHGILAKGLEELDGRKIGNIWSIGNDDRLILVSWALIRDVLSEHRDSNIGFTRWAALSINFLDRVGIRRFKGFLQAHASLPSEEVACGGFYGGSNHGFNGFKTAGKWLPISDYMFKSFFKE